MSILGRAFPVLVALVVAICGGGASAWYFLDARHGFGALTIGPWVTYPDMGTADADPYSRARAARSGQLVAGTAEGLTFVASIDSGGAQLRRECAYALTGPPPSARFWTLYAADENDHAIGGGAATATLKAQDILRNKDGGFTATVAAKASPGNWLRTAGSGDMRLVLTLYDTPATSTAGSVDLGLPSIASVRCDG